MQLLYIFGFLIALPLFPIVYFQGKNIRKNVPRLPPAKKPKGFVNNSYKNTLQVLCIGESTIAGVGVDTHKNGFSGAFAKRLSTLLQHNIKWVVYAKSGYTASKIAQKTMVNLPTISVDVIVIGLGGNDAFTLNSPKKWAKDIDNIIQILRHKYPKTPIYFTNMPPIKEFPAFTKTIKFVIGNLVEILGKQLYKVVTKHPKVYYNKEVITLQKWTHKHGLKNKDTSIYFSDGIHPSKQTYTIWGQEMADFVAKNYLNNL
ncbi:SGNH/GDSL hydrolase family protein [Polaribacter tangerinus]|uniref:SGNH/GDSL hydrolase family protein n=1 Tax=Polaribacter tangerinus TaxID=1920034 RepID=UPI000B4AA61C|nr:SGNH/GDSL hydrolase family protein [Polaribacter tangerinus]